MINDEGWTENSQPPDQRPIALRILRRLAVIRAARERDRSYHNFIPHPFPRRHDHTNATDRADAQP